MTDRDQLKRDDSATDRPNAGKDSLREGGEPLKREGDALRDGSGSRQGQSPPTTGPRESP